MKESPAVVSPANSDDVSELVELMREFYAESNHQLDATWAKESFLQLLSEPRGIAHALLSELMEECRRRGCKSTHVEVDGQNAAALGLYGRFGLRPFLDGRVTLHAALR